VLDRGKGRRCLRVRGWTALLGRRMLNGKRSLFHDRDPLFTAEFLNKLADAGVASVKFPPRSPNLKRLRGTVCTHDQGSMSGADDLVRRERSAESDC
jgi:hypothetical protein